MAGICRQWLNGSLCCGTPTPAAPCWRQGLDPAPFNPVPARHAGIIVYNPQPCYCHITKVGPAFTPAIASETLLIRAFSSLRLGLRSHDSSSPIVFERYQWNLGHAPWPSNCLPQSIARPAGVLALRRLSAAT